MATSSDLIESAALKLGAKQTGEALTASEASDSLKVLNSMLDFMAMKKQMVYQVVQDSYSWVAASSSRTIGSGGNFDGTRPVRIESAYFRDSGNTDYPVEIIRDRKSYDALPSKTVTGTYPNFLFYDTAFPLGVLYAYPVPSATLTLKIGHWKTLQSFAELTTDLALPPGYQWMIEHNLAVALQSVFSIQAPPSVVSEAALSKKTLMDVNHYPITSSTEIPFLLNNRGKTNILTGA